jgi:hypothetical protein
MSGTIKRPIRKIKKPVRPITKNGEIKNTKAAPKAVREIKITITSRI